MKDRYKFTALIIISINDMKGFIILFFISIIWSCSSIRKNDFSYQIISDDKVSVNDQITLKKPMILQKCFQLTLTDILSYKNSSYKFNFLSYLTIDKQGNNSSISKYQLTEEKNKELKQNFIFIDDFGITRSKYFKNDYFILLIFPIGPIQVSCDNLIFSGIQSREALK